MIGSIDQEYTYIVLEGKDHQKGKSKNFDGGGDNESEIHWNQFEYLTNNFPGSDPGLFRLKERDVLAGFHDRDSKVTDF